MIHDSSHCDSQKAIHGNIFHGLHLLYRTRDQLAMKVLRKRKEAEKFEFEPWPQASQFSSWKVSFRTEVTTGSTHLRLASERLAEFDLPSGMEELDWSGFIFDKDHSEFETLGSKVAEEIMKIIPPHFKRKINFLEETQYKK